MKVEKRSRKTRISKALDMFKILRNNVADISNTARREFYFMRDNSGNQGRLYRATKALLLPKDDSCMNK